MFNGIELERELVFMKIDDDKYLKERIDEMFVKNDIQTIQGVSKEEITDSFLRYTPIGRQIILNWYNQLSPTKTTMSFIKKAGFENKYFYIGGTDAAVALMLLGFKVNDYREVNTSDPCMEKLDRSGYEYFNKSRNYNSTRESFFIRSGFKATEINQGWAD
ncbi:TPA: hypothetical protein ACGBG5_003497 [Enterococcus faecalis]